MEIKSARTYDILSINNVLWILEIGEMGVDIQYKH